MAEWTICPSCQLKHSVRNDGLCPRCQSAGRDGSRGRRHRRLRRFQHQPPVPGAYPPAGETSVSPVKWVDHRGRC